MYRMRPGTIAAVVLAVVALIYVGYSLVITPRMDSGVSQTEYRPPIQDQPATEKPKPPLQNSNAPPAGPTKQ